MTSEFFAVDNQSQDGLQSYCRRCKALATKRAAWLRKWGISENLMLRCLSEQDDKCPICLAALDLTMRMHIDHDHDTEEIRGVLHPSCNSGAPKNGGHARRWAEYCADPPMRRANGGQPLLRRESGLGVAQLELAW